MNGTGDYAADAGDERRLLSDSHDAGGGADYVDHIAGADSGSDGVPVRIEGAYGDGDSGLQTEFFGPFGAEFSGDFVGGFIAAAELFTHSGQDRVESGEELFGGQAAAGRPPH